MVICSKCGFERKHYAKGMCRGCYQKPYMSKYNKTPKAKLAKIFYFEQHLKGTPKWRAYCKKSMRIWRAKNYFGLTVDEYNQLATKCAICGFDITVQLHHKDKNRKNNDISNLVPLCPNHHRMAHMNLITFDEKKMNYL